MSSVLFSPCCLTPAPSGGEEIMTYRCVFPCLSLKRQIGRCHQKNVTWSIIDEADIKTLFKRSAWMECSYREEKIRMSVSFLTSEVITLYTVYDSPWSAASPLLHTLREQDVILNTSCSPECFILITKHFSMLNSELQPPSLRMGWTSLCCSNWSWTVDEGVCLHYIIDLFSVSNTIFPPDASQSDPPCK